MSDGQMSFAAVIDTSGYEQGLKRMADAMKTTTQIAEQSGQKMSSAQMFGKLQEQAKALSGVMSSLQDGMRKYAEEAQQAMATGNTSAFNAATDALANMQAKYDEASVKAQEYAEALQLVKQTIGGLESVSAPMLFDSAQQRQEFDAIQQKVAELKEAISTAGDADTSALQSQLDALTEKSDRMAQSATDAAMRLGADLGNRAAEAQEKLVALNSAVGAQEQTIKSLKASVKDAALQLAELKQQEASQEEIDAASVKFNTLTQQLKNAQAEMANLRASQIDAQRQWGAMSAEVDSHNSFLVKLVGGQERYNQILGAMPAPLRTATQGITSMITAAKAFIATPLGAVISAIVLALQALKSWFDSSVAGQLKFAEISGYVSGVLGQLKEIVINVGEAIYSAFTEPQKAASAFVDFIKSQVVNRVKALGEMFGAIGETISNVFTGHFDDAKESLKRLGNAYVDFGTGVQDTTQKISAWASSVKDAANATAQISRGEQELRMEASKWQIQKGKIENQMADLQRKMYDSSLSKAKRQEYSKQYKELVQTVSDGEIAIAKKALQFQEKKMSLTTNSIEDETLRNELEAKLVQAEGYAANRLRMLQRIDNRLASPEPGNANAMQNAIDKQQRDIERSLKDLEMGAEQARINAMEEGEQKVLDQLALNHQKEIEELTRQKEDYLQKKKDDAQAVFAADKANKGKKFDSSTITLSDEEIAIFDKQLADIEKKHKNESDEVANIQKEAMNEYLRQWGEYTQKRQAIIDIAQSKLKKATTEGERLSIVAQMNKDLSDLDLQAKAKTSAITKLFGDMSKKSAKQLRELAADGKKALDLLMADKYDNAIGSALDISEETWKTLKASPEELEKIRKAIEKLQDDAEGLETPLEKIKAGLEKIFDTSDANGLKDGLKLISEGLSEALASVSVLEEAFTSLGDALGSSALSGAGQALNTVSSVASATMKGAQAGAAFGPWGAAAGAAIGMVGSLGSALAKLHDAKHEKKIKELQEKAEALQRSYDVLGKSIEKAYSKDASNLLEQQNALLKQQKVLIQQQIKEEEAKKKTDENRIKQWKEELQDIDDAITENKEKAIDAIFGEDVKSAIESFADAYATMFDEGNSKASASKNIVKTMIKSMIQEAMKSDIAKPMEALREKMLAFWTDGYIDANEQGILEQMSANIMDELQGKYGWADNYFKSTTEQSASSGAFQAMSQQTGDELNGRFTALQINAEQIRATTLEMSVDLKDIRTQTNLQRQASEDMRSIQLVAVSHLEAISKNTKELYQMNERLAKIEKNTSQL